MHERKRSKLLLKLFADELRDYYLYTKLAASEKNPVLKSILRNLAGNEMRHARLWSKIARIQSQHSEGLSNFSMIKLYFYIFTRKIFGLPFTLTLLSRNEMLNLKRYERITRMVKISRWDKRRFALILSDERKNAVKIRTLLEKYGGKVNNMRSIVLGLNDGLVEVLAAVSGIAVIAVSPWVVALSGMIIGIAGTLSMAGGVYLSTKSHGLIASEEEGGSPSGDGPNKQAFYTGIFYLGGAISVVLPFLFGASGFLGIALSIIISCIILALSSAMVAILSNTSTSKRAAETLGISLSAVAITIMLGIFVRFYFGITI